MINMLFGETSRVNLLNSPQKRRLFLS